MIKNKIIVTGAAGFIGSHLVDELLKRNYQVIGIDNLSTGKIKFLNDALKNKNFKFIKIDLMRLKNNNNIFNKEIKAVFHMAANADVRFGSKQPKKNIDQNIICTFNILEECRKNNIKKIIFASTGSVYGEANEIPTSENSDFPIQTSIYGASKLSGEGLLSAYAEAYGIKCWIFRFVSILGPRYTHGHVYDFFKKLKSNSKKLYVFGNGKQRKSYLHVHDCISAMMIAINKSKKKVNIFNLGTEEYSKVDDSIKWISKFLNVLPKIKYSGGSRGWIGDSPFIFLDTKRIRSLGWKSKYTIKQSVEDTLKYFLKNKWIFK